MAYDDGSEEGHQLGRRFGNAAGMVIPHEVVTPLKVGDRVNLGDPICYNNGFFEPDFFNPKQIVLKNATSVKTVLWESTDTLEDGSSISKKASELLRTKITKKKTVVVSFDQSVSKLVKVGDVVDADTSLCIIENAETANNKLFDESSIDTLRAVSAQSPRAGVKGVVERVEIYYYGDIEDMSKSLQALAAQGDKQLRKEGTSVGRKPFTGSVDGGFRLDSDPLPMDAMAIRVYITSSVGTGVGDKAAFCHQLKSVISSVMEDPLISEDGDVIDAVFGGKSIQARIVSSSDMLGTSMTLLKVIAKKACAAYRS